MKKLFTLLAVVATTLSLNAQVYFSEDFEGGVPAGWTAENAWEHGTSVGLSSQYFEIPAHTQFMGVNDDAPGAGTNTSGRVYTTAIDLTDAVFPTLIFEAFFIDGDFDADEQARVLVSTDNVNWDLAGEVAGGFDWQEVIITLGDYAGQTIYLAFEYLDGGGWNYGFAFDDIEITDYTILRDARMVFGETSCGGAYIGKEVTISGTFENRGTEVLTSVDINWSANGTTYTETLSGLSLGLFETYNFEFADTYAVTSGNTTIDIWVSNVNGQGPDEDPSNDATDDVVTGVALADDRGVIVEEATGTWCPWCPRGTVWMDRMTQCYGPHFVGVAVHNDDPMEVAAYDAGVTSFPGFTGFPSVIMEREVVLDPSEMEAPFVQRATQSPDALLRIGATYDDATSALTVTVYALANVTLSGDYRLNAIIVENDVTGTGSAYNQANNYAGGAFGPMGGYENLPNPVPAAQMVYDHVGRALLGGFAGQSGSLPATLNQGEWAEYAFSTYTIPANFDQNEIEIMATISNPSGEIINAWKSTMEEALLFSGVNDVAVNHGLARVYPNPFVDVTNIELNLESPKPVTLRVVNAMGQVVAFRDYGVLAGNMVLPFDGTNLEAGMYFLHLNVDNTLVTKKVMLTK